MERYKKHPDPHPPISTPELFPSLRLYVVLFLFAIILIVVAFLINIDVPGLALNLATEIIGAIIILIVVEQRIRSDELQGIQGYLTTVLDVLNPRMWRYRGLRLYATILFEQLKAIEPQPYVSRPQYEDLLRKHPNGFILIGSPGVGKTVLMQRFAQSAARDLRDNPRISPIPVYVAMNTWHDRPFLDHVYDVMSSYHPISRKRFFHWLEQRKLLVIADGLDECRDMRIAIDELNQLCMRYTNLRLVMSSRPYADTPNLLKVVLSGISEPEAESFMDQWGIPFGSKENIDWVLGATQGNLMVMRLLAAFVEQYGGWEQFFADRDDHPLGKLTENSIRFC